TYSYKYYLTGLCAACFVFCYISLLHGLPGGLPPGPVVTGFFLHLTNYMRIFLKTPVKKGLLFLLMPPPAAISFFPISTKAPAMGQTILCRLSPITWLRLIFITTRAFLLSAWAIARSCGKTR